MVFGLSHWQNPDKNTFIHKRGKKLEIFFIFHLVKLTLSSGETCYFGSFFAHKRGPHDSLLCNNMVTLLSEQHFMHFTFNIEHLKNRYSYICT